MIDIEGDFAIENSSRKRAIKKKKKMDFTTYIVIFLEDFMKIKKARILSKND